MRHSGGWIKMHRSLSEHPAAHDGPMLAVFMWLLLNVNWKPSRIRFGGHFITVLPGQIVTGSTEIAAALAMSRQVVRTRLAQLEQIETINRKSTNRGTLITIMNWSKYQDETDPSNRQPTNGQPTNNQQTTNHWPLSEEGKKERREEEEKRESALPTLPPSGGPSPRDLLRLWLLHKAPNQLGVKEDTFRAGTTRWVHAKARLADNADLGYWESVIKKIAASSFCKGTNNRAWVADFGFLLTKEGHVKVMEGKYDDRDAIPVKTGVDLWLEQEKLKEAGL